MSCWGHYADVVDGLVFLMFMATWNLLALDAVQQFKKHKINRKKREQWR